MPDPERYLKKMSLTSWVESKLWDDRYFDPTKLSAGVEVFRSRLSFPLVASLIDGCHGAPQWEREQHETPTDALFRALRGLVQRYGASWIYITDPDNALSVVQWEKEIDPEYFNSYQLIEFEKNPAEEGGASFLCVAFHDREGIVVIECETSLNITLYGTSARMDAMLESLGVKRPTENQQGITSRG